MMEKGYRPKTSWDVVTGKNHRSDELGRFYSKGDDVDKEKGARLKAMTLAQMGKYDEARQSIQNSPVWDKENSGDRADKDRAYKDILSTIAFEKKKNGIKEDSPDHAIAAKGGKFSEDTDKTKKMHRAAADNAEGVVIGGGRKQTNFYITIQKMNEGGINIHTTNLREGAAETKQIVEEMMLRAVSDWQVMAGD